MIFPWHTRLWPRAGNNLVDAATRVVDRLVGGCVWTIVLIIGNAIAVAVEKHGLEISARQRNAAFKPWKIIAIAADAGDEADSIKAGDAIADVADVHISALIARLGRRVGAFDVDAPAIAGIAWRHNLDDRPGDTAGERDETARAVGGEQGGKCQVIAAGAGVTVSGDLKKGRGDLRAAWQGQGEGEQKENPRDKGVHTYSSGEPELR